MKIKILALIIALLTLTACKAEAEPKLTELTESETVTQAETAPENDNCWAYNAVYDGAITITYVDEESCFIAAEDEYNEDLFFLAVTAPFKIGKEFEAVMFEDGYIAVYEGEEYVGTYEVHRSFNTDEALESIEGAMGNA